jgi:23S rRNA pseudouridine955/2504/2580 synthase
VPATTEPVEASGVRIVEVPEDRAGQRLDNLLVGLLKGVPKSHVYRLLRTGQVRVDGKRAKADHRVAAGERLRIPPVRMAERDAPPRVPDRALAALAERIVHEDRRFIALDKPSGLASHGGSGIALGAIEQLRQLRPDEPLELVHRLDRDTSGVLLVARKRSALRAAQAAIREGRARKRYLALLVGRMPRPVIRVDAPLEKSVLRGGERMVEVSADGKPARTEFRRIEQYSGHAFVEVLIDTGRTHQIRVHARHIGLPVAGDPKYGDPEANAALREAGLRRLFLHGAELSLDLGDPGTYSFHAPLPSDLAGVLDRLVASGPRRR